MNETTTMIIDNGIQLAMLVVMFVVLWKTIKKERYKMIEDLEQGRRINAKHIEELKTRVENHEEKDKIVHGHVSEQLGEIKESIAELKNLIIGHLTGHGK